MPSEGFVIREEALARLERINPGLFRAVRQVMDEERAARDPGTLEEWKLEGHKWFVRISRLRRAIRRQRLKAPSDGKVY